MRQGSVVTTSSGQSGLLEARWPPPHSLCVNKSISQIAATFKCPWIAPETLDSRIWLVIIHVHHFHICLLTGNYIKSGNNSLDIILSQFGFYPCQPSQSFDAQLCDVFLERGHGSVHTSNNGNFFFNWTHVTWCNLSHVPRVSVASAVWLINYNMIK